MSADKPKLTVFDKKKKEEKDYWVRRLSREVGPSGLPPDFTNGRRGVERQRVEFSLPDELHEKLLKVTGASPFLLYTSLMAAAKLSLHKLTGSESIIIGSPARRKDDEPVEPNIVAVLDDLDGAISFGKFLKQVRETLIEAYSHQEYPYERLVRDLEVDRRGPLFDLLIAYRRIHVDLPRSANDVTLNFDDASGPIECVAEYDSSLFRRETIERFVELMFASLRAGLESLDAPIRNLDPLSPAERRRITVDWNQTSRDYPKGCVQSLIEDQARRTPDAVAVLFEEQSLTFDELNRSANRVAHYLRSLGAAPGALVGVFMERSLQMVVSVLGILKAGAAYVPLDPAYPPDRTSFVLEDSGLQLIIAQEALAGRLPQFDGRVLSIDAEWRAIGECSDQDPTRPPGRRDLAYVIYTSGSTGAPKGVLIEHQGLCNFALAYGRALRMGGGRRVLQFAPLGFDASVSELFPSLASGATLCLARRDDLITGQGLTRLVNLLGVTTATLPPAFLSVLAPEEFQSVEVVSAAGESCPAAVAEQWSAGRCFINAYGPTEATVCSSLVECGQNYSGAPPIGKPIANTQLYILDSALNAVPVGAPGELCVGGDGLARGYLNRPELAAEKFIPNPFAAEPGSRLYRTGDLTRFLSDGNVDFLGRVDHQVKIRGFRIEPGEIESAINEYRGVQTSVVVARADGVRQKRLIAYVVPDEEAGLTPPELQQFLRSKLPEHMVPSAFVLLDALPLSVNGKIDRRALPSPSRMRPDVAGEYVAPRNQVEQSLSEIWSEIFGIDQIGVHDNFFELGGHSVLATQVISRVRETFHVEVRMGRLFESPTIAGLADAVSERQAEQAETGGEAAAMPAITRRSKSIDQQLAEIGLLSEEDVVALSGAAGRAVKEES
jgi:amino acid adenylation domain-containing protein